MKMPTQVSVKPTSIELDRCYWRLKKKKIMLLRLTAQVDAVYETSDSSERGASTIKHGLEWNLSCCAAYERNRAGNETGQGEDINLLMQDD